MKTLSTPLPHSNTSAVALLRSIALIGVVVASIAMIVLGGSYAVETLEPQVQAGLHDFHRHAQWFAYGRMS